MTTHSTFLKDSQTGEREPAEIHDALRLDELYDAEAVWASARVRVRQSVQGAGLTSGVPQSHRWDWSKKAGVLSDSRLSPLGDARLIGIRCRDEWQGLVWCETCDIQGGEHTTRLGKPGRNLVYVPFIETAPWNWDIPASGDDKASVQSRAFRGIGMQLLLQAVLWSEQLEFKGRVALHSLPQSEEFYRHACGMTDLGNDSAEYQRLRYFEFTEEQANSFMGGK